MFRNLAEDATIEIYFETIDSTGAPVAPSSAFTTSDFAIYKNGSATAKATTNGLTVTSPFNSEPGCHLLIADTSNDTGDSGFWTTGARYQVKFNTAKTVGGISIDGRSVPRGMFGIQSEYMRGTDSAALAATALSTAVWTATIAGRIDVTLSTLATAASIITLRGADSDTLKTLSDQIDGTATAANQTKTLDRLGYIMAQEIGACADAGTAAESYTLTIDTTTYTIDHTGLDATGNRGTATLTKS